MNKRQKKKHNKQFGSDKPRNQNKTQRGRLTTMVLPDKKKAQSKNKCRGKINYD